MADFHFNNAQKATFDAVADCIVPADEYPGAAASGAVNFLLRLLGNELTGRQQAYIAGLAGIEQEAMAVSGRSFVELPVERRVELLKQIEVEQVQTAWLVSPGNFFTMLVEHVLEGYYADPENGGNLDAVSWKMVGYRADGGLL